MGEKELKRGHVLVDREIADVKELEPLLKKCEKCGSVPSGGQVAL